MIAFRIKQKMRKGICIFDIQAYFENAWRTVYSGGLSMDDVYAFFSSAKEIVWNVDGLSGSYSF